MERPENWSDRKEGHKRIWWKDSERTEDPGAGPKRILPSPSLSPSQIPFSFSLRLIFQNLSTTLFCPENDNEGSEQHYVKVSLTCKAFPQNQKNKEQAKMKRKRHQEPHYPYWMLTKKISNEILF